jgi:purine-binding chemotaxis protein CheW
LVFRENWRRGIRHSETCPRRDVCLRATSKNRQNATKRVSPRGDTRHEQARRTTMSSTMAASPETRHATSGKYLTFTLDCESYGIDVLKIREIIRVTNITTVPQMPAYIRGVINLRGKIIPVMDLRLRFGFEGAKSTEQTCIVVVQVKLPDGKATQMGLVVDGVEEVVNIAAADIEETPDFGAKVATDYLVGMAKIKGAVKALLDIDRVLAGDDLQNPTKI